LNTHRATCTKLKISNKEVKISKQIGGGNFGVVSEGTFMKKSVAVKQLSEDQRVNFIKEVEVIKSLPVHPNIVTLIAFSRAPKYLCIVTDLWKRGSLDKMLTEIKDNLQIVNQIAAHVASGMNVLHAHKIIHRDLAARNVLVNFDEQTNKYLFSVADFGLARPISGNLHKATLNLKIPVRWTAPEGLKHQFCFGSDVWSFGIVLIECLTGSKPYPNIKEAKQVTDFVTNKKEHPSRPSQCNDAGWNLLLKCWKYNADERPTFQHLFQKFLKNPYIFLQKK